MFQRVRELEAKLEIQKRHLKELEEKVGGEPRASLPPPPPPGFLLGQVTMGSGSSARPAL